MFGDAGEYPGAKAMEERILNLPLRPDTARVLCPALAKLAKKMFEGKGSIRFMKQLLSFVIPCYHANSP